ncbi:MAG: mechanosensitive ion channel [Chitinophagaceae bacterium]|nr:mechanosensitive ion channel [Chitinophagaceae bacterium]MCW5928694.1 mechanosensitive ion channel [Chitinophagaceae bacterium]
MSNNSVSKKSNVPFYFFLKLALAIALFFLVLNVNELAERKWPLQLITGAWTFLLPSIFVSITRFIIIAFYNARHKKNFVRGNFVLGINRLTAVLNAMIFGIAIMIALGINPKEFLTSLTIVAMAIAVIFREYITNMISGLLIMFSNQLSVGDRIKVGDNKGRVEDITLSNIVLKNEEDDIVLIPSNLFFIQPVTNLSVHRSKFFYVKFELPLQVATRSEELGTELRELFRTHPELDMEHELKLRVEEIGKDFVRFKIELIAKSSSDRLHREIENEVLKQILVFQSKH